MRRRAWFLTFLLLALPAGARAAEDRAIVVATVVGQNVVEDPGTGLPLTRTRMRVDRLVSGDAPAEIVISEFGGRLDGRLVTVSHAASYTPGRRYLVTMQPRSDGSLVTTSGPRGRLAITENDRGEPWVYVGPDAAIVRRSAGSLKAGLYPLTNLIERLQRERPR